MRESVGIPNERAYIKVNKVSSMIMYVGLSMDRKCFCAISGYAPGMERIEEESERLGEELKRYIETCEDKEGCQ